MADQREFFFQFQVIANLCLSCVAFQDSGTDFCCHSTCTLPSLRGEYLMSTSAAIRHDRMLSFKEGVSALLGVRI